MTPPLEFNVMDIMVSGVILLLFFHNHRNNTKNLSEKKTPMFLLAVIEMGVSCTLSLLINLLQTTTNTHP